VDLYIEFNLKNFPIYQKESGNFRQKNLDI